MLDAQELLLVGLTTTIATAIVTGITVLVLRVTRRLSIGARVVIVVAGAVVSIAASAVAVATEMYLSHYDLVLLAWVIGISAVMSMVAAWLVARASITTSIATLISSTRRVGAGDVVPPVRTGWHELDRVGTELAETSERLSEARAQVAELDAARRQFFAWISHDLRTPLAGMRAMAEALEAGTAPDPEQYIRLIRGKVDTVTMMVADLFELSQLQSGTLDLHPEAVVLLDLVSDAVSDVQAIAASRGIRIIEDGIEGHMIWADPREITRAIGNLLANGVRHAPPDSAIIIRADTLGQDELVLSIIDQGDGVSAENLGRMFDVGWRADSSRTPSEFGTGGGAGLGLAIVRGIIEAHGGRVIALRTADGFQLDLVLPTAPQ